MAISFQNALGVHEQAMLLRNKRTEVLANNIANADTPGYKARDIDFKSVLNNKLEGSRLPALQSTHRDHISMMSEGSRVTLSYRIPSQPSLDGNTVDEQFENAAFARNAIEHQASFQFLNGKFTGLRKAIKGE